MSKQFVAYVAVIAFVYLSPLVDMGAETSEVRNVSMILRHLQLEFKEAVHRSLLWPQAAD
jgi:hypothetical protein